VCTKVLSPVGGRSDTGRMNTQAAVRVRDESREFVRADRRFEEEIHNQKEGRAERCPGFSATLEDRHRKLGVLMLGGGEREKLILERGGDNKGGPHSDPRFRKHPPV